MAVAPRAVVEAAVVGVEGVLVVDSLVAEDIAEGGEPSRVGCDVAQPDEMAELVADVPERCAVLLAERRPHLLTVGGVGFVEVERDQPADVTDEGLIAR